MRAAWHLVFVLCITVCVKIVCRRGSSTIVNEGEQAALGVVVVGFRTFAVRRGLRMMLNDCSYVVELVDVCKPLLEIAAPVWAMFCATVALY
jgi:hypothetical protein